MTAAIEEDRSGDLTLNTASTKQRRGNLEELRQREGGKTLTKKQGNERWRSKEEEGGEGTGRDGAYPLVAVILLLGDERFVIVGEGHERGTPMAEGTMEGK